MPTRTQACLTEFARRSDAGAILIGAFMLAILAGVLLGVSC